MRNNQIIQEKKKEYRVYLSSDCVRGMLLETARHPGLECFVQMPGVRKGNDFYFDMVADSGPNATYEYAMCEKDHEYVDHLATMLSQYYEVKKGEETVSQFHKHPPNFTCFSSGDIPANQSLARQYGGVVNGLILVNPNFNLKMWYIDEEGRETPVEYEINDTAVREAMPRKGLSELTALVESQEDEEHFFRTGKVLKKNSFIYEVGGFVESIARKVGNFLRVGGDTETIGEGARQGEEKHTQANIGLLGNNRELLNELNSLSFHTPIQGKNMPDGSVVLRAIDVEGKTVLLGVTCENEFYEISVNNEKMLYYPGLIEKILRKEEGM